MDMIALLMMFVPSLLVVFPAWKSLLKNSQSLIPIMLLAFLLCWEWREKSGRSNGYAIGSAKAGRELQKLGASKNRRSFSHGRKHSLLDNFST